MMKHLSIMILLVLAACSGAPKKDYTASAYCGDMGYKIGTADYDTCLKEETAKNRLALQRAEFEQKKQDEHDYNMIRHTY